MLLHKLYYIIDFLRWLSRASSRRLSQRERFIFMCANRVDSFSSLVYVELGEEEGKKKKKTKKSAPHLSSKICFSTEVTPLDKEPQPSPDPTTKKLLFRANSSPHLRSRINFSAVVEGKPKNKDGLRKRTELGKGILSNRPLFFDKLEEMSQRLPEKRELFQFLKRFPALDLYLLTQTFIQDQEVKKALLADGHLEKISGSPSAVKPLFVRGLPFEGQEDRLIQEDLFPGGPTFPFLRINGVEYKFPSETQEIYFTALFKALYEQGLFNAPREELEKKAKEDAKKFLDSKLPGEKRTREERNREIPALRLVELFPIDSFRDIEVEFRSTYFGLFSFEGIWSKEVSRRDRALDVYILSQDSFCVVKKEKMETYDNSKKDSAIAATFDNCEVLTYTEGRTEFSQIFMDFVVTGGYEKKMRGALLAKLSALPDVSFLARFPLLDQYVLASTFLEKKLRKALLEEGRFEEVAKKGLVVKPLRLKEVKFQGQQDEVLRNELCGARKFLSFNINGKLYAFDGENELKYFGGLFEAFSKEGFFSQNGATEEVKTFLEKKLSREERNREIPWMKLVECFSIGSFAQIETAFLKKYPKLFRGQLFTLPADQSEFKIDVYIFSKEHFCVVKKKKMKICDSEKKMASLATFDDRKVLTYREGKYFFSQLFLDLQVIPGNEKVIKGALGLKK